MNVYKTHREVKEGVTFYNCNINTERHANDTCEVIHTFTNIIASVRSLDIYGCSKIPLKNF